MPEKAYATCVDEFCLPNNYSQSTIPKEGVSTDPAKITIEFSSLEVLVVNDIDFTVTLRGYLGIHWREPRLIGPGFSDEVNVPLDLKFLDYLWLPDLEILYIKEISDYYILNKLAGKPYFTQLWITCII